VGYVQKEALPEIKNPEIQYIPHQKDVLKKYKIRRTFSGLDGGVSVYQIFFFLFFFLSLLLYSRHEKKKKRIYQKNQLGKWPTLGGATNLKIPPLFFFVLRGIYFHRLPLLNPFAPKLQCTFFFLLLSRV
jgi:hypothetical protein